MVSVVVICAALGFATAVSAEEFRLPDASEISSFSPSTLQLYQGGVRALDRTDYTNAYNLLSKASMLQPAALRLNLLTAGLSLKHGRSKQAAEAKGYYETAIACYQNALKHPELDDTVRRDLTNRLKVATDERDNLAQRDARREAMGGQFITNFNREYAVATPNPAAVAAPVAAAPTPAGAVPVGVYGGPAAGLPAVGVPAAGSVPPPAYYQAPQAQVPAFFTPAPGGGQFPGYPGAPAAAQPTPFGSVPPEGADPRI
jgi:hypothetical protein